VCVCECVIVTAGNKEIKEKARIGLCAQMPGRGTRTIIIDDCFSGPHRKGKEGFRQQNEASVAVADWPRAASLSSTPRKEGGRGGGGCGLAKQRRLKLH